MANAKPKVDLKVVDEDFQPDPGEPLTDDARQKLSLARVIKEGRRREREDMQRAFGNRRIEEALATPLVQQAHDLHVADVRASMEQVAKHQRSSARWQAAFFAAAIAAVLSACATAAAMSSGMFSIVAADRARQQQTWTPPEPITTHAPEPETGYANNPQTGRPLHPPADAPNPRREP